MTTKKGEAPVKTGDCLICDEIFVNGPRATEVPLIFRCRTCGAPLVQTRDGTLRSVIIPEWVEPTRRLWKARKRDVAPGFGFDPESIKDGPEVERDRAAILAWFKKNHKSIPASHATWGRTEDKRFA